MVLEAQRTYRSVLSDYYAAIAAHAQARAELEWALGVGSETAVETSGKKGSSQPSGTTPGKDPR
jgi:hypothetical protein